MVTKVVCNSLWIISAVCTTVLMSDVAIASEVTATTTATQGLAGSGSRHFLQAQISSDNFAETRLRENQPIQPTVSQQSIVAQNQQIERMIEYSDQGDDSQAQVTSVSQLSDVQPTDWAFQALQGLVERSGCIAGYPDGTFRGNRVLTRYEFAAGLKACLDRVNELIVQGLPELATNEELATV